MKHRRGIVFRQNLQQLKSDNKATELRMLTTQEVKIYKAKKSKVPKDCYFTSKYFRKISMFLVKREHRKLKSADRKESCLKTLKKKKIGYIFLILNTLRWWNFS